jgi:hypothetical protein
MQINIVVRLQVDGLHHWPSCDIEEVAFLRDIHRHMFHIEAKKIVNHEERDVEIIKFKRDIQDYLYSQYWNGNMRSYFFGPMSCESIARELVEHFKLSYCSVLEDNENGAEVFA